MAEPAGAHVATDSGMRRTATSYWVDGKDGKMPWSHKKVAWLVAVPLMALLLAIATPLAVRHIEGTLVGETRRDLTAVGIDPSGLNIDFDYRSGDATGTLPAGVTAATAEASVEDGLLRELNIVAEAAAEPASAAKPAPPAAEPATPPAAAAELGPTELTAQLVNGEVVLTGVVLSEAQRASIVDAAVDAVGEANVRDELTVSGFDAATAGADERIGAMAAVLATLGGAETATVVLTDTSLDVTALASGTAAADTLAAAADGAPVSGAIAIDVPQGPTDVDVRLRRGNIILRGAVLSEAQRAQLVEAAAGVVGALNVDDRLEVTGLAEATPGADDRVAALAGLVGQFGNATTATGTLSDAALRMNATTRDQASADSLIAAGGSITATDAAVTATARPPQADAQIVGLQAELDGLAAEIRQTVVFATGSAELSASATATLDKLAAAMEAFSNPVVEVSGHTDNVGDAGDNESLSAERAAAVVAYVTGAGIGGERLQSRGAGAAEPIADNNTSEGRAQNRRVEFTARSSF